MAGRPREHRAAGHNRFPPQRSSRDAGRCWTLPVTELLSGLVLAAVAVLLLGTLAWQFTVLGPRGTLLDRLAILPQWKFFGQSRIATDPCCFDDLCLLARLGPEAADPGAWQEVLWWEDRPVHYAWWNPRARSRAAIGTAAQRLAITEPNPEQRAPPTALAYLTVLRHCLDALPPTTDDALQFAIALTRGRDQRTVSLAFLSAWHRP